MAQENEWTSRGEDQMSQAQDSAPSASAPDCQCPTCGRLHKHLQAGTPPMAIAGPSLLRPAETLKPASPSAAAPDGRLEMAPLCIGWATLDELCRKPHMVDVGPGLIAASDLLADPPVRASTRPPAIDGQAWPSEEELARTIYHAEYAAEAYSWADEYGKSTYRAMARAVLKLLAAAPPAQGSAGWRALPAKPSEALLRAGWHNVTDAEQSYQQLFAALTPPVEAQGSERMLEALTAIVRAHDLWLQGDGSHTESRKAMELAKAALGDSSPATVEPTIAELQKRVADAQAALAYRVLGDPRTCVAMPSPATEERYGLWIDPGPKR